MIIHKDMSLFDAPSGSFLVHAVNCRGVWGSGIAKEFGERFPKSYEIYRKMCKNVNDINIGTACILPRENDYKVCCLFTSRGYGIEVDSPDEIRVNTALAIHGLLNMNPFTTAQQPIIYSNKFNSGFFNVPWEQTEYILDKMINQYCQWIVCDPK